MFGKLKGIVALSGKILVNCYWKSS